MTADSGDTPCKVVELHNLGHRIEEWQCAHNAVEHVTTPGERHTLEYDTPGGTIILSATMLEDGTVRITQH